MERGLLKKKRNEAMRNPKDYISISMDGTDKVWPPLTHTHTHTHAHAHTHTHMHTHALTYELTYAHT